MAHIMNTSAHALPSGRPGVVSRLVAAVADFREYLRTYDELNALSDHELADIGLSRLNVRDVARSAVYGR